MSFNIRASGVPLQKKKNRLVTDAGHYWFPGVCLHSFSLAVCTIHFLCLNYSIRVFALFSPVCLHYSVFVFGLFSVSALFSPVCLHYSFLCVCTIQSVCLHYSMCPHYSVYVFALLSLCVCTIQSFVFAL